MLFAFLGRLRARFRREKPRDILQEVLEAGDAARPFWPIQSVLRSSALREPEKLVWIALWCRARGRASVTISRGTLSSDTGFSSSLIEMVLPELRDAGLIQFRTIDPASLPQSMRGGLWSIHVIDPMSIPFMEAAS